MKIGSRGKLVMIYNDHFRWTRGTLKNTETHVASPRNGAEMFSEHMLMRNLLVKKDVLGDGGVVVLLQINYTCIP